MSEMGRCFSVQDKKHKEAQKWAGSFDITR